MTRGPAVAVALAVLVILALGLWWVAGQGALVGSPALQRDEAVGVTPDGIPNGTPRPASPAALPSGEVTRLEVAGAAPEAPLVELRATGRVVDEQGRGLADADVWLLPSQTSRQRLGLPYTVDSADMPWDALPRVRTAADGRFALAAQEMARASGHRPPVAVDDDLGLQPLLIVKRAGFVVRLVALPGSGWSLNLGEVALQRTGGVTGRAVDEGGRGLVGLRVRLPYSYGFPNDMDPVAWQLVRALSSTITDDDGRFLIDTLPPGESGASMALGGPGRRTAFRSFSVQPGGVTDLGAIEVARGAVLAGRVTDAAGASLSGVELAARPSSLGGIDREPGMDAVLMAFAANYGEAPERYQRRLVSDDDGRFRFDDLDPVPHDLFARLQRHEPLGTRDVATGREDVELRLPPEALIVLRVVDAATGEPLEGVTVSGNRHMFRGGSSHPEFEPGLTVLDGPEAAARLGLDGDGHGLFVAGPAGFQSSGMNLRWGESQTMSLEVPGLQPGEIHEQTLSLEVLPPWPRSSLAGTVRDTAGAPLGAVEITASPIGTPRGRRTMRALSGPDGRFMLADVPTGRWAVRAQRHGYLVERKSAFDLSAAEPGTDVDFSLQAAARLSGVLFAGDGRPSALHEVTVWRDEERRLDSVLTDGQGRFLFEALPPGAGFVTAHRGAHADVELVAGEEVVVQLHLRDAARLSGHVRDAAGRPMTSKAKVRLYVEGQRGPAHETDTDRQGAYRFDDLPALTGRLFARTGATYTAPAEVQLGWGSVVQQDLAFAGGRLRGRVLRKGTQEPVPDVALTAYRDFDGGPGPSKSSGRASTDASGAYVIEGLLPGPHRLVVMRGDWVLDGRTHIDVGIEGADGQQVVEVIPSATLTGRVSGSVNNSARITLHLQRLDAEESPRSTRLYISKDFTLRGLRPGRWGYEARGKQKTNGPEFRYARGEFTIGAGEGQTLDLFLEAEPDPLVPAPAPDDG